MESYCIGELYCTAYEAYDNPYQWEKETLVYFMISFGSNIAFSVGKLSPSAEKPKENPLQLRV